MEVRFEPMIQMIKYCFICCSVVWGPDLLGARWAYKYFNYKINLNISLTIIKPNFRENVIFWMSTGKKTPWNMQVRNEELLPEGEKREASS